MPVNGQQELLDASGKDTANATVTAVSAPSSGNRIKLFSICLNVKTADELVLKSGSTEIRRFYLGDASGLFMSLPNPLVCGDGEALTITKTDSASTEMSYAFQYLIGAS